MPTLSGLLVLLVTSALPALVLVVGMKKLARSVAQKYVEYYISEMESEACEPDDNAFIEYIELDPEIEELNRIKNARLEQFN